MGFETIIISGFEPVDMLSIWQIIDFYWLRNARDWIMELKNEVDS